MRNNGDVVGCKHAAANCDGYQTILGGWLVVTRNTAAHGSSVRFLLFSSGNNSKASRTSRTVAAVQRCALFLRPRKTVARGARLEYFLCVSGGAAWVRTKSFFDNFAVSKKCRCSGNVFFEYRENGGAAREYFSSIDWVS